MLYSIFLPPEIFIRLRRRDKNLLLAARWSSNRSGLNHRFDCILYNTGDRATVEIQREEAFIYAESTNNERGIVDGVTGATVSVTTQGAAQKINFLNPGEKLLEPTTYALTDFRDCNYRGNLYRSAQSR